MAIVNVHGVLNEYSILLFVCFYYLILVARI